METAAREAKMKGDKMEEEVDELIKVSQSLEVVNFTVSTSGDIFF